MLLPYGYHPVSAPPGYRVYYLWALSGDARKLVPSEDPQHKWIHDAAVAHARSLMRSQEGSMPPISRRTFVAGLGATAALAMRPLSAWTCRRRCSGDGPVVLRHTHLAGGRRLRLGYASITRGGRISTRLSTSPPSVIPAPAPLQHRAGLRDASARPRRRAREASPDVRRVVERRRAIDPRPRRRRSRRMSAREVRADVRRAVPAVHRHAAEACADRRPTTSASDGC